MNVNRILPLLIATGGIVACSGSNESTLVTPDPAAAVRWINAVSDTMPMDYRFTDVASNASQDNLAYKAISGNWRRVPNGTRHMTVFQTGEVTAGGSQANAPSVVSKVLLDTTAALSDKHLYSIFHVGYLKASATPKAKFVIIDDILPSPAAGTVGLRVFNANPTTAVDVYAVPGTAVSGTVSGTPIATNVAFGTATAWLPLPTTTAPAVYVIKITATGSTTVIAEGLAPAGIPGRAAMGSSAAIDAVAGSQTGASALTAVYFSAGQSYAVTNPAAPLSASNPTTFPAASAGITFVADVSPSRISP